MLNSCINTIWHIEVCAVFVDHRVYIKLVPLQYEQRAGQALVTSDC